MNDARDTKYNNISKRTLRKERGPTLNDAGHATTNNMKFQKEHSLRDLIH